MSSSSWSGRLTDAESADLTERVERFRAAWAPDGSTDLGASLPPPNAGHRRAVLVQIVLADMERRAAARLPFRIERYIGTFPDDLASETVPAELLAAEYRLRHRYTDRPALAEYERWFPNQYPALAEHLRRDAPPPSGLNATTPASVHPIPPSGTVASNRNNTVRRPPDPTPVISSSDILPSDAPYRLIRKLGEGAFGEVFEARAPGEIPVAVKRIMRPLDHPSSRSEKEALEAIKRLSHPFLLKTNAYWVFDDRLVIVMELADGSLTDRIEHHQGKGLPGVPPEELVPLFEQAAEALDYLHGENISHRDVKPENILILKGYAKVADFGLVRTHEHTMTVVGQTAGTPAYMAPEMWQQKVSLQSDQYSLAATYVRSRLGRNLFDTNVLIDMANSHMTGTPDLAPLPEAERKVLLKALAKNPDHRYASCAEFAKALRLAVLPPPEPPKPRDRDSRPNVLVMAVSVAIAVAIAVALVMAFFLPRGDQAKEKEREPEKPPAVVVVQKPPEKPLVAIPEGWTADAGVREFDDKRYPNKLTRQEAGETLEAILIYPTGKRQGHPLPFYMLKTKISNRVFAKVWQDVEKDPDSEQHRWKESERSTLLPKQWEKGAVDYSKKEEPRFGMDGLKPDWPVLGVTVPEAILVAQKLGGALPKYRQWQKATGEMEPAANRKELVAPLEPGLTGAAARASLKRRDLGLGQDQPLPISAGEQDRSFWDIRQLVSNGREWMGNSEEDGERLGLSSAPDASRLAIHVGSDYHAALVMDFDGIRNIQIKGITTVAGLYAGFRIVLEPR